MSDYNFIIDNFVWSFSRLTSFTQCPYNAKRRYIDCEHGENNAAAENGLAVHQTLEEWLNGKVDLFDLPDVYEQKFDELVVHDFPYNKYVDLRQSTHDECLEYFENLTPLDDSIEVLGVELEECFMVGKYNFVGYIDLLFRNKDTGDIYISDHKSFKPKWLKRKNDISKSDKPKLETYKKQLYLYATNILDRYGKVDFLRWNLFRQRKNLIIPFNLDEYKATQEWAISEIEKIKKIEEFTPNTEEVYFCLNLCDFRNDCVFKERKSAEVLAAKNMEMQIESESY